MSWIAFIRELRGVTVFDVAHLESDMSLLSGFRCRRMNSFGLNVDVIMSLTRIIFNLCPALLERCY